jgi:hypothetical protein
VRCGWTPTTPSSRPKSPPGTPWPASRIRRPIAELGRAAVAYARSVALDRRLRTTVPEWNAVGLRVAELSGFVRSGSLALGGRQYIVLEQPATRMPAAGHRE